MKVCVVGAGISGLSCIHELKKAGVPYVCYEKRRFLGGIWNYSDTEYSVYRSCVQNHPRALMSINGIDIQQSNDDYVNHEQYLSYLKQFDCENIAYEVEVLSAEQLEGGWRITTSQGVEEFAALIVCSGHYVSPNIPADFDKFTCRVIHSCQYKEPSTFRGERVLIVGAGSSAIQIASDLVEVAESIFISTRKMPYVLPRYVNGKTLLSFYREVKDLSESEILAQLKEAGVDQSLYGLPPPQQSLLGSTTLPIGDTIFKQVQNGDVKFISEIIAIYGNNVHLKNDEPIVVDSVLLATGFNFEFSFFTESIDYADNVDYIINKKYKNLYFVGMVQPIGPVPPMLSAQARVVASIISGSIDSKHSLRHNFSDGTKRVILEKYLEHLHKKYFSV